MSFTTRLVSLESLRKAAIPLLFALAIAPSAARSQIEAGPAAPRLFDGNLGDGGDWLHVLDAPTLSDRIYWNSDPDSGLSYQVQVATDTGFESVASNMDGIEQNWVAPNVEPGFYYFHVRATDTAGRTGPWSEVGTLELVVDEESPTALILSPVIGQTFSSGDTITIELQVSDDTVLRKAHFMLNGEDAGTLGLATENFKIYPSFGVPRTVTFDITAPKKKSGALEIQAIVSDVMYKSTTATVTLGTTSDGGGGGSTQGSPRNSNRGGPKK